LKDKDKAVLFEKGHIEIEITLRGGKHLDQSFGSNFYIWICTY
jgi:hypothetical protein